MDDTTRVVKKILKRWKQTDLAWRDKPPLGLSTDNPDHVLSVFGTTDAHKSGIWECGLMITGTNFPGR